MKNEEFKPYLEQALTLANSFDLFFIKWVPDTQNKAADALARKALQKEKIKQWGLSLAIPRVGLLPSLPET